MNLVESLKPTMDALYKQEESWSLKKKIQRSWFCKMICGSKKNNNG